MNAKIKSIKKFSYQAVFNFGEIIKGNRLESIPGDNMFKRYNENGELVKEGYFTRLSNFESPELFRICEQNEQGQIILDASYLGNQLLDIDPQTIIKNSYNKQGKLIESFTYKIDKSNSNDDWLATLDDEGNVTPPTRRDLADLILKQKTVNKYDNNKLIESKEYDEAGNLTYKETWAYNSKGHQIERIEYETEEEIDTKYVYIYDDGKFDGKIRLLEIREYNSKNTPKGKTLFIYDKRGRRNEVKGYNEKDILVDLNLYKYNEYGSSQEVHYLDSDGNLDYKMIYKYNLKGSLLEEGGYNPDGGLYSKESNSYNENENLIESRCIEFDEDFVYTSEKYKYDQFNNWIQCIKFNKDIPVKIIEQEIDYF
jgi:hypothetical protein